jgi:hydroxysqualene dehydroxylase
MSGGTIPLPVPTSPDALVIGGGIAGLCAATDLSRRGWSVMLVEQTQHLGGRVYSFIHAETGDEVDNGQHLMLGCYHSALRYLHTVGSESLLSLQETLAINFRSTTESFVLHAPALPPPLHMLGALATLRTLTVMERLALLRIVPSLLSSRAADDTRLQSMTVAQWLDETGQTRTAQKHLWNILAVGTLNETPDYANAAVFVRVLRTIFLGARHDASIALPRRGLSRLFGEPGAAYLASHNGCVRLGTQAGGISIKNFEAESAVVGGETLRPKVIVSAVPSFAVSRIFAGGAAESIPALVHTDRFIHVPIVSIHLWFTSHFMDEEFTALLDSPIDWVFNKSKIAAGLRDESAKEAPGGRGLMYLSLVVSAARQLAGMAKDDIAAIAVRELRKYFPGAAQSELVHSLVVKEKRATFSPARGIDAYRPSHGTVVRNLFLAGDWTDTKLPATIEGAAQSGYACADAAHAYLTS